MKIVKVATGLLVAAVAVAGLAACSSASSTHLSGCESATANLAAAQADVTKAQAAVAAQPVNPRVGTPEVAHVQAAKATLVSAQRKLDASTTAKAKACEVSTSAPTTPSASVDTSVLTKVIKDALTAAGFTPNQYTVGAVNPAADNSTAAALAFQKDKKLQSAADVVAFLSSGTPQAEAVIAEGIKQTGATRAELLAAANWIPVQFTGTAVRWGGNTYYTDGAVAKEAAGGSVDNAGTTAVMFIPPQQVAVGKVTSIFVLRGACGNPQTEMPTPYVPPTTPPTTPPCTTPEKPNDDTHVYRLSPDKCSWVIVGDNLTTGSQAQSVQADRGTQPAAQQQPTTVPSTEPASQPTQPLVVTNPSAPTQDGTNGGSTVNPVPTGTPTPVDTGTHTAPIPTPTGGAFAAG